MRPFNCIYCPDKFKKEDHLINHQNQVHMKQKVICTECNFLFHPLALRRHQKQHCFSNEKMFVCNHCDKKFARNEHLNGHIDRMHNKKKKESREIGNVQAKKKSNKNLTPQAVVVVVEAHAADDPILNDELWCIIEE